MLNLTDEFVLGMAQLCAQRDILLMVDEVQTGNGRTGKLYAFEHYGITPDVVSTAKGLGGGLPIGATMIGEKAETVLDAGSHGSTFGGNPVCCAGALNILKRLDDKMLDGVKERSAYLFEVLSQADGVESVSGMGLMIGVKTTRPAADVIAACMEKGLLVIKAKDKVRLLPALNIPMDVLKKAVEILKQAIAAK